MRTIPPAGRLLRRPIHPRSSVRRLCTPPRCVKRPLSETPVRTKDHHAKNFPCACAAVCIGFDRRPCPATAQRHAGRAEGVRPRRPAFLPLPDGSGRFHHSCVPAAKPYEADLWLPAGVDQSRTVISRRERFRLVRACSGGKPPRKSRDSIGFAGEFPIYGVRQRCRVALVPTGYAEWPCSTDAAGSE